MPTSTESPASPRFSLASTVSIALVLSAVGGYYLSRPTLVSLRPEPSPHRVHRTLAEERVPARLWEDPLVAAQTYFSRLEEEFLASERLARDLPDVGAAPAGEAKVRVTSETAPPAPAEVDAAEPSKQTGSEDSSRPETIESEQRGTAYREWVSREFGNEKIKALLKSDATNASPPQTRVVGVAVSPFSYAEDVERRVRTRDAVVQSLLASGYEPRSSRHIGLFAAPLHDLIPREVMNSLKTVLRIDFDTTDDQRILQTRRHLILYPYEVWEKRHSQGEKEYERVFVFWIPQDSSVLSQVTVFGLWTAITSSTGINDLRIVGPIDSDALAAYQHCKERFIKSWKEYVSDLESRESKEKGNLANLDKALLDNFKEKEAILSKFQKSDSEWTKRQSESQDLIAELIGLEQRESFIERLRETLEAAENERNETVEQLDAANREFESLTKEQELLARSEEPGEATPIPMTSESVSTEQLNNRIRKFLGDILEKAREANLSLADEREAFVSNELLTDDELQHAANSHFHGDGVAIGDASDEELDSAWMKALLETAMLSFGLANHASTSTEGVRSDAPDATLPTIESAVAAKLNEMKAWYCIELKAFADRSAERDRSAKERSESLDRLTRKITAARKHIDTLETRRAALDSRIEKLKSTLTRKSDETERTEHGASDLEARLRENENALETLTRFRSDLEDRLKEIEGMIVTLTSRREKTQRSLGELTPRLENVKQAMTKVERIGTPSEGIRYYSAWATNVLADSDAVTPCLNGDDTLLEGIEGELATRALLSQSAHGVLIVEGDSRYGREWIHRLNRSTSIRITHTYRYLRGIDGRTDGGIPASSQSTAAGTAQDAVQPFGNSHSDYIERMASTLAREGEQPDYVILIGSDVFDKLLILRALRPILPGTLIVTTDLDAAFLSESERPFTRNLVVVSDANALSSRLASISRASQPTTDSNEGQHKASASKATPPGNASPQAPASQREQAGGAGKAGAVATGSAGDPAPATPGTFFFRSVYETAVFRAMGLALNPLADGPGGKSRIVLPPPQAYEIGASSFHPLQPAHRPRSPETDRAVHVLSNERITLVVMAAIVCIVGGILRSILRTHMPGLPGSNFNHSRDRGTSPNSRLARPLTILTLVAAGSVLAAGYADIRTAREPVLFFDGISVWPTITILVVTILFVSFSILFYLDSLGTGMFLQSRTHGTEPVSARTKSSNTSESQAASGYTGAIRLFGRKLSVHAKGDLFTFIIASAALLYWTLDCASAISETSVIDTVGISAGVEAHGIFRSRVTWVFYNVIRWMTGTILVAFTVLVVVEMKACRMLVCREIARFREKMKKQTSAPSAGVAETLIEEVRASFNEFEGRGRVTGTGLIYVGIAVMILLLAKHQVFDNWSWTPAQLVVLTSPLVVGLYQALRLQASARAARAEFLSMLGDLRDIIFKLSPPSSHNSPLARERDEAIEEIASCRTGLFAPVLENPIVMAVLTPLGGIGTLPILTTLLA